MVKQFMEWVLSQDKGNQKDFLNDTYGNFFWLKK